MNSQRAVDGGNTAVNRSDKWASEGAGIRLQRVLALKGEGCDGILMRWA